jgi:integrase
LLRAGDRYLVVGVEGKAREPFGTTVAAWNNGGWGKRTRLADLCERLDLDPEAVGELRYQLLDRTLATLLEAARYGVPWARIGEQVGHADLFTTARTYTHVLGDEGELDYANLLAS